MAPLSQEKQNLLGEESSTYTSLETYGGTENTSVNNLQSVYASGKYSRKHFFRRIKCESVYVVAVLLLAISAIIVGEFTLIPIALQKNEKIKNCEISPDPGVYPNAAITTDDYRCSEIARKVLQDENGSAVDAAISAILCLGVVLPHVAGLGGGVVMTLYTRNPKQEASVLNSWEASQVNYSEEGEMIVEIPGQIKAMWEAHQKFGKLTWKRLFGDSVKLCRDGSKVSPNLAAYLSSHRSGIKNNGNLKNLFWNSTTNDVHHEGDIVKYEKLADTLEKIALGNEEQFYRKETAKILVRDVEEQGGILSLQKLGNYSIQWRDPITSTDIKGMKLFGAPLASCSSLVFFILNVMNGYKSALGDIDNTQALALIYHRLIETSKFGMAVLSELEKSNSSNVTQVQNKLLSKEFAEEVRLSISDVGTFSAGHYGADHEPRMNEETSHVSVLAPDGSAAAVTTYFNSDIKSMLVSQSTGIILNILNISVSTPQTTEPLPSQELSKDYTSTKRLNSASPIIIVDPTTGNVTGVLGSSGGASVPTTLAQVMLLKLFFEKKTHDAVMQPRLYPQLIPNLVFYERNFTKGIINRLEQIGHKMNVSNEEKFPAANVIFHTTGRCISTYSDPRKCGGKVSVGF